MAQSYSAQVKNWNAKTRRNMSSVMKASIQEVMDEAQKPVAQGGNMPVDVGNLQESLASGLNGSFGPPDDDSYTLTIAQMNPGDTANFKWTAAYARARHYKPSRFGQGGGMWRDKAAAKWQRIVDRVAKRFS